MPPQANAWSSASLVHPSRAELAPTLIKPQETDEEALIIYNRNMPFYCLEFLWPLTLKVLRRPKKTAKDADLILYMFMSLYFTPKNNLIPKF